MHELREEQDKALQNIQLELKQDYEEQIKKFQKAYTSRLENLDHALLSSERSERSIVEKVEQLESSLEEIESRPKPGATEQDLKGVVGEALKNSVSIVTDKGRGSGAILSKAGYVATNYHLVAGADSISITDYKGKTSEGKPIVLDDTRDIAILKSSAYPTSFTKGDSDKVVAGERVIAVGSPERLDFTVTQGIVSAANRVFFDKEGAFIQTDVPMNKGSSGGPLVNMEGELIGINTFKIRDSESLGFAVPVNDVMAILDQALSS